MEFRTQVAVGVQLQDGQVGAMGRSGLNRPDAHAVFAPHENGQSAHLEDAGNRGKDPFDHGLWGELIGGGG